ncbi:hypothetical protein LLS1_04010 [Leifsonia sp. LS1]|uniref:DUF5684 domain-containing protein n=1 Tax=Leifsonia sp. LS1 TaxID=2828483 RepID=UPI001CFDA17B|nr:DUF5684 domain-containing protein [Leifsonia sp. LS1]GIT78732.1 hypothetical protein LLS1_04010 [Leifsonia sp. LS1]
MAAPYGRAGPGDTVDYTTTTDLTAAYGWSALGGLVAYVFYGFALMGIFGKAGLKRWPAWVPFFSTWRLLQLGGQKGWLVLIGLIPIVGQLIYLVFLIIAGVHIQCGFGKPGVFYLLAILVTPVWYGILAWDRSVWAPRHTPIVPRSGYAEPGPLSDPAAPTAS